jgi:hypothetical protein
MVLYILIFMFFIQQTRGQKVLDRMVANIAEWNVHEVPFYKRNLYNLHQMWPKSVNALWVLHSLTDALDVAGHWYVNGLKNLIMVPKRGSIPKRTDRLTVGRNVIGTWTIVTPHHYDGEHDGPRNVTHF